jgi:hypothetical protein
MTNPHIPDEVRKAALAELNNAFLGSMEDKMAAVLTAALQAWPGTGMAKSGFGYPFAEDRPDNWIADSHLCKEDLTDFNDTFPVLIIRTEAPRT